MKPVKPVLQPQDMSPTLARAFNARDLDAMVALYDEGAVFVDEAGVDHRGADAIRAACEDLLKVGGTMTSNPRFALVAGDIALSGADWRLEPGAAGEALEGRSLEVLRRRPDGSWRYLVDCPIADLLVANSGLLRA